MLLLLLLVVVVVTAQTERAVKSIAVVERLLRTRVQALLWYSALWNPMPLSSPPHPGTGVALVRTEVVC